MRRQRGAAAAALLACLSEVARAATCSGVADGTACATDGSSNYHSWSGSYSAATGKFAGTLTTNLCPGNAYGFCKECNGGAGKQLPSRQTASCTDVTIPVSGSQGPSGAPLRGRVGVSVSGVNIYGPMEAGFGSGSQPNPCTTGSATCSGGLDVPTCEETVKLQCGSANVDYALLLDTCGGHAMPYHYHADLACDYDHSLASHSPLIGIALDGYGIYGLYEAAGKSLPSLDTCNGHTGAVPGSTGAVASTAGTAYHYHVTSKPPYTLGCFGPVSGVSQCRGLYSECGSGFETVRTAASPAGLCYDLDCPCFDSAGGNADAGDCGLSPPSASPSTSAPSSSPTASPVRAPSAAPTVPPSTSRPSLSPTPPAGAPTASPATSSPTAAPSRSPTGSGAPPSASPATSAPSRPPTRAPLVNPTGGPSVAGAPTAPPSTSSPVSAAGLALAVADEWAFPYLSARVWDQLCYAGRQCRTVALRPADATAFASALSAVGSSGSAVCVAAASSPGFALSYTEAAVRGSGASARCHFTRLTINGDGALGVELYVELRSGGSVLSRGPSLRRIIDVRQAAATATRRVRAVVRQAPASFDRDGFAKAVAEFLGPGVQESWIVASVVSPVTLAAAARWHLTREARPLACVAQPAGGTGVDVSWYINASSASPAATGVYYDMFVEEVTSPSSQLSTDLCGVAAAWSDWDGATAGTGYAGQLSLAVDADSLRYSYLTKDPWADLCWTQGGRALVCRVVPVRVSAAGGTLTAASNVSCAVVVNSGTDTYAVTGNRVSLTGTAAGSPRCVFTSLALWGPPGAVQLTFTAQYPSGEGSATMSRAVNLTEVGSTVTPVRGIRLLLRTAPESLSSAAQRTMLAGVLAAAARIPVGDVTVREVSQGAVKAASVPHPACPANSTSGIACCGGVDRGTSVLVTLGAVTEDSTLRAHQYDTILARATDADDGFSASLCGVEEATTVWGRAIVREDLWPPQEPSGGSDDEVPTWAWGMVLLAVCLCAAGAGFAIFGVWRKSEPAGERISPGSSQRGAPMEEREARFGPQLSEPQCLPAAAHTVTAELVRGEVDMLQAEIDVLEKQRAAIARNGLAGGPVPQVLRTDTAELSPLPPMRVHPTDGPVAADRDGGAMDIDADADGSESDFEVEIRAASPAAAGGATTG